jgi:hypothetical protein
MKNFRDFLKEEVLPTVQVADGGLDIEKPAVRAAINAALASVTSQPAVTPYVVQNRVSKLLAQYHIVLPRKFLEGDRGVEVYEIRQFGHKMGMTDSGEFVNEVPSTHYLFMQYGIITPFGITYAKPVVGGMFRVMARLVDKAELDKLLDMAEITMAEEAECMQNIAKANAPKEPMHDITSDEKKKGNKEAVKVSEKGLDEEQKKVKIKLNPEKKVGYTVHSVGPGRKLTLTKKGTVNEELSHGARELTLHADNDSQLHRSSHQPIIKNLQRKHAKGSYDHDKATKLWGYHANRAAKSYEKQHGGKFSVADRKAAASHFANSARDEHGFGSVKEEKGPCWKGYEMIGMKKKKGKPVPNCVPVKEEKEYKKLSYDDFTKGRIENPTPEQHKEIGRRLKKAGVPGSGWHFKKAKETAKTVKEEIRVTKWSDDSHTARVSKDGKVLGVHTRKKHSDLNKEIKSRFGVKGDIPKGEEPGKAKTHKIDELNVKFSADDTSYGSNVASAKKLAVKAKKAGATVDRKSWDPRNVNVTGNASAVAKIKHKMKRRYDAHMSEEKGDRIEPAGAPITQKNIQHVAKDLASGQGGATFAMKGNSTKVINVSSDSPTRGNKFTNRAPLDEKAPPGAKFERMVKHIKKGYAKDGELTAKEKGIAFATAWKAKNREKGE